MHGTCPYICAIPHCRQFGRRGNVGGVGCGCAVALAVEGTGCRALSVPLMAQDVPDAAEAYAEASEEYCGFSRADLRVCGPDREAPAESDVEANAAFSWSASPA